jgi:protein TonB
MLEDSLFESQRQEKTRKPLTVAIAVVAHVVTIIGLVLIPLLQTQALTLPPVNLSLLAPRLPINRDHVDIVPAPHGAPKYSPPTADALMAPASVPPRIVITNDGDAPPIIDLLPTGNGGIGKIIIDTFEPNATSLPPVAPTEVAPLFPLPKPVIKKAEPIRIGGGVQAALLLRQVKPVYPRLAQQARAQGVVVMEAVIAADGSVKSLRVVSGHALLTQAAVDAVQQWLYRPTLLNGEPVEVATTITVTFTLQ